MKPLLIVGCMSLCSIFFSCHQKQSDVVSDVEATTAEGGIALGAPGVATDMTQQKDIAPPAQDNIPWQNGIPSLLPDWEKKIIKIADISIEVKNFIQYDKFIHFSIKKYGAYISGEQQRKSDGQLENTLSIKVPVEQFDALMNSLSIEHSKIVQKQVSSEDVSGQIVDIKARIEAKKQVRDRYLILLQKADKIKDILDVQRELNVIQEDLEAAQGRLNYLAHQSSYSTINVSYFENTTGSNDFEDSFFSRFKQALADGASLIGSLILVIISYWPIGLAILAVWIVIKRRKQSRVKAINSI